MPTSVYSAGPAAILVGRSATIGGAHGLSSPGNIGPVPPTMLGWCERSPQIEVSGAYTPLFNTLGGVELPYAYLYQGAEGRVFCTMTKWDDFLLAVLEHLYVFGDPVTYHSIPLHLRGLFVAVVYPMWASANTAALVVPPHAAINIFPICRIERIEKRDQGTMPAKVTVVFHAMRSHSLPTLPKLQLHSGMGSMGLGAVGGFAANDTMNAGGNLASLFSLAASTLGLIAAGVV